MWNLLIVFATTESLCEIYLIVLTKYQLNKEVIFISSEFIIYYTSYMLPYALHYPSSTLPQLYTTPALHYPSSTLPQLYTTPALHYPSSTLPQLYTTSALHYPSSTLYTTSY